MSRSVEVDDKWEATAANCLNPISNSDQNITTVVRVMEAEEVGNLQIVTTSCFLHNTLDNF